MDKNKLFFLLMLIAIGCKKKSDEYAQNKECICKPVNQAKDKYFYPVLSGSSQWNQAGSAGGIDSIYRLCQVPFYLLQNMTTLGMLQSLEDNPTLTFMFLRDNKIQGRNEVLSRLNVSWELNKRFDAGKQLLTYYNQKSPCCIDSINIGDSVKRGKFVNQWHLFDMVATQDSLLTKLLIDEKKSFANSLINNFYIQEKYSDVFGSNKTTTVLILSQLMILANYQPYLNAIRQDDNLRMFSQTGILTIKYDQVLVHAKIFLTS